MAPRLGNRIYDDAGSARPDDVLFEERQGLPVGKIAGMLLIVTTVFFGVMFVGFRRPDMFALVGFLMFLIGDAGVVLWLRKAGLVTQVEAGGVRVGLQIPNMPKGSTRFELGNLDSVRTGTWESLGVPNMPFSPGRPLDDKTTVFTAGSERAVRLEFGDGRILLIGSARPDRLRDAIQSAVSGQA